MTNIFEKINSAEYIYSSLTKWGLKKYICDVGFFLEEPLDDLCFVICSILNTKGGYDTKRDLGILLGFSMSYQNEGENTVVYYDKSEVHVFEDLLAKVQAEHLIRVVKDDVFLTNLGRISVSENKHYSFYRGTKSLYEHLKIKTDTPIAMMMFPFYNDMGIFTPLQTGNKYWPDDDVIESIIYPEPNQLIKRLENQSKDVANIYYAELRPYFDIETVKVPIKLYLCNGEYLPIVMNDDDYAIKATTLIFNELNSDIRETLTQECLFQKLWDDKSAILNYSNLEPYIELIDFEELTKDPRTVWTDSALFSLITNRANSVCWSNISRYCDISVICDHIEEYEDYFNWPILTERIDNHFLLDHFKEYPWDLEVLSEDYNRDTSIIEELILQQKETEEDWDWEELELRLSESFVLSHLDIVKVDLDKYTKDSPEVRSTILNNPDKRWNWDKIEQEFSLEFIYSNIGQLGDSFAFTFLLDRIFSDPNWADKFASKKAFREVLRKSSTENGALSSTVLNLHNYIWTFKVIDTLEECGLIRWETTEYMKGFECNPYLSWNMDFFKRYYQKVATQEGIEQVSKRIEDLSIILSYPDFGWNWHTLSSNSSLLSNKKFFTSFGGKLDWSIVFENQTDKSLFQSIAGIDEMIKDDQNAWTKFSTFADVDFVVATYKDKQYPWDWSVLTSRMFSTKLRLENLGNKSFVNKWDWNYLSQNLNEDFIISNLDKFKNYWSWDIILPRIITKENCFDYAFLDPIADTLTNISGSEKCQAAWKAFTMQFSFVELKKLIKETARKRAYWWDISYFCQHEEFDIYRDLEDCRSIVDWDVLSSSQSVDNCFKYNPKLGIKPRAWYDDVRKILDDSRNKWNFNLLSHFSSLRNQRWFLERYKDKVDWKFLSEACKLFSESDKNTLNGYIQAFKSYLDFSILSERTDVDVDWLLKAFPQENYDFNQMVASGRWSISHQEIEAKPNYNWDWEIICAQDSFKPSAKFLMTYIDKPLNWSVLCHKDLGTTWTNEPLLMAVASRDIKNNIDWYTLSSNPNFPVSQELLKRLPLESLNWEEMSKHKAIFSVIDQYEKYIDWQKISENLSLNVKDVDFIEKHKDKLDWYHICRRQGFVFTNDILDKYSEYIDWTLASQSLDIEFTKELVERYKEKWNWPALISNKAFNNRMELREKSSPEKENIIRFINQFPSNIKPRAYHFTHMANAIKIIKTMKLQCRNYADGNFENSAGSNVLRTNKAHKFARFYFAPLSPTQFYNECLGKDSDDKQYYRRAFNLGLPKCPLPVFFVIDIEELLMAMPDKCFYSNGNMQKDSSKYFQVTVDPTRIKAKDIYKRAGNKEEKQQEFLVEGEVDLSKFSSLRIYCYDEYQKEMLCSQIKGSSLVSRIAVGGSLYQRTNKKLEYDEYNDELEIDTNYVDNFEFRVKYDGTDVPNVVNKEKVIRQKGNDIFVDKRVILKKDIPFEVYFEVKSPRPGSWLIYKNTGL